LSLFQYTGYGLDPACNQFYRGIFSCMPVFIYNVVEFGNKLINGKCIRIKKLSPKVDLHKSFLLTTILILPA